MAVRKDRPAAHLHGRQRGRREEHADRTAAARLAVRLRGPGARRSRRRRRTATPGPIDFSLFTDGLSAEREQGITIDVAYRYFATARRKFILADTPGHEQYTRNMATGASTADLAILLIDARNGVRDAVPAARANRAAARHHRLRARDQQDGPGRLRPRCLREIRDEFEEILTGASRARHPDERAARRQRHHAQRAHALVRRAAACSSTSRRCRCDRNLPALPVPVSRCSWCSGRTTISAATPDRSRRASSASATRVTRLAVRPHRPRQAHRHLRRRPRRGVRADVGHADARRRDRHQPRRRADPTRNRTAASRRDGAFEAEVVGWTSVRWIRAASIC